MESIHDFKEVIRNDSYVRSNFCRFLSEMLQQMDTQAFEHSIEYFLEKYLKSTFGLNSLYRILKHLDEAMINEIIQNKDWPTFSELTKCIPPKLQNKQFTLLNGLEILENYGQHKEIGINQRHQLYLAKVKANKQSAFLKKKDLNGLLGVSNLFKKEIIKNPKHKSKSVWTVKKR